jgi:hypothetical protein
MRIKDREPGQLSLSVQNPSFLSIPFTMMMIRLANFFLPYSSYLTSLTTSFLFLAIVYATELMTAE